MLGGTRQCQRPCPRDRLHARKGIDSSPIQDLHSVIPKLDLAVPQHWRDVGSCADKGLRSGFCAYRQGWRCALRAAGQPPQPAVAVERRAGRGSAQDPPCRPAAPQLRRVQGTQPAQRGKDGALHARRSTGHAARRAAALCDAEPGPPACGWRCHPAAAATHSRRDPRSAGLPAQPERARCDALAGRPLAGVPAVSGCWRSGCSLMRWRS